jgi:hypothetical protein
MSSITITLTIDPDMLRSVTDEYLHSLWHIAQANPAPQGDRDAGNLVGGITAEIVRRWLKAAPAEQFNHTPTAHHWTTLVQHGNWRGPGATWLPYSASTPTPNTGA